MSTYQNKKVNSNFHIKKKHFSTPQRVILLIIFITSFAIVISLILAIYSNKEQNIKNKITFLAKEYYENYLYEKISSFNAPENAVDVFNKYKDSGFTTIYLRQLLFYTDKNEAIKNYLKLHCDENRTSVKFYPEQPYSKSSYRTEFIYSCDFE